ncbi:HNH endonuclease [Rosenbergiella nectarea]|uniref:HNH endonuclease n=1 Tax=Rosenbergiella nectarea TaxID=988801 RepID=A0A1H9N1D2_9GAMM|nr:HNH endonuclease signature motif containing protein [Rosenbergiella nectarea]SER29786.1 HNH endonuclease [Rosenbergiella nectarea]
MKLTPKQRTLLRMKFGGCCAYCGCELPEKGWHADHVEALLRKPGGGAFNCSAESLDNLFPACAPCNLMKSAYELEVFRRQVSLQVERARKSSVNIRTAERFGLIEVIDKPVVFWFETYKDGMRCTG